jgi:hypothetical protein
MPATILFKKPINVSVQVGDLVFYTLTYNLGGYNISNSNNNVVFVGQITRITEQPPTTPTGPVLIEIYCSNGVLPPVNSNPFFMFRKNNVVNTDGIKGYFAEVTMVNDNSKNNKVELFATSAEVQESSK